MLTSQPANRHAAERRAPYGARVMLRSPAVPSLLLAGFVVAQDPVALPPPPAPIAVEEFAARRARLLAELGQAEPDGRFVVLVRGGSQQADMGAFVQDQDFLYLTGVAEPGLALLLAPGTSAAPALDELLVPPFSRFAATWDGNFLAPGEESAKRTGFRTAGNVRALDERLKELLAAAEGEPRPVLYTLTRPAPRTGSTPGKAAGVASAIQQDKLDGRPSREQALIDALQNKYPGLEVKGIEGILGRLRATKSAREIDLLRGSTRIAAEGIAEAMKSTRPGLYEFQVAAVARYVFSLRGAGPDAYAAIVGGGPNGCILHYNACTRQLRDDDLIVMDYAPTLSGYASDVTRTFPASGTFTAEQRKLVQDVFEIQKALIADVKPGARLSALSRKCSEMLRERGYRSDHGPCHHVGLAVHDPSVDELQAGMVITVEPGAYLREAGMGCRIEDTILVTESGCENLSGHLPSSPDAIEALMKQKGVIDVGVGLEK